MTWVAYYSDLSEVAVFEYDSVGGRDSTELRARRYAMEHCMDVIDLPDSTGLRETINAPSEAEDSITIFGPGRAVDQARLLGPDLPHPDSHYRSLLEVDLTALVVETLDLGGCVKFWQAVPDELVRIERYMPGSPKIGSEGDDLSGALVDYRIKEAKTNG